jgi:hypothetical protein
MTVVFLFPLEQSGTTILDNVGSRMQTRSVYNTCCPNLGNMRGNPGLLGETSGH